MFMYMLQTLCTCLRLSGVSAFRLLMPILLVFVYTFGFLVLNLEAGMQGCLESSHVYRQRQADVAHIVAVSIQTAWRALQARRLVQQMRTAHQHNLKAVAAAGQIQVRLATVALSSMSSQQQTGK